MYYYNIMAKKKPTDKLTSTNAGDSSVHSAFHWMHGRDIMGVMELISDTHLVEKLVAAPVSAHYNMRVAVDGNFKLKEDLRLFLRSIRYVTYIICFFGDEAIAHFHW